MILPIFLIFVAIVAVAAVAYGMLPAWGQYSWGLDLIVFVRQYQWPLAALALIACLALLGLIVSGKRRAWWLIGLAPVLALLGHHLYSDPLRGFAVLDDPKFVAAEAAQGLKDDDCVLGTVLGGQAFAYPYGNLYSTPILIHTEHDKRMLLLWSPFADYPTARLLTHELHARDLSLVSMPGNALIIFNGKHSQFINGITGRTVQGEEPLGFGQAVEVKKRTWKEWKTLYPKTQVMQPPPNAVAGMQHRPLAPTFPMPPRLFNMDDSPTNTRVTLVATALPVAAVSEKMTERPLNVRCGVKKGSDTPAVMILDPKTKHVVAFVRRIDDLDLHFKPNPTPNSRPNVVMVDEESKSGWNVEGKAVDGTYAQEQRKLVPLPVVEGCYWGVMKVWMPDILLMHPELAK